MKRTKLFGMLYWVLWPCIFAEIKPERRPGFAESMVRDSGIFAPFMFLWAFLLWAALAGLAAFGIFAMWLFPPIFYATAILLSLGVAIKWLMLRIPHGTSPRLQRR